MKQMLKLISSFLILFLILGSNQIISFAETPFETDFINAKALYFKDKDRSVEKFHQIVTIAPDNVKARLNLVRILREKGEYREATQHLQTLLSQNPNTIQYRLALIQTTYLAGEPQQTVYCSNYIDLTPEELYWRGLALQELSRDPEAIQALIDSITGEPFNPMAYYRLGQLYQRSGNYENAITFYKKAAKQDPNLTEVYYPIAQCYISLAKYSTAYDYLINAKYSYSWDVEIKNFIERFLDEHPYRFQKTIKEEQGQRQGIVVPKVTPILENRDKIPFIRIGLAEKISSLYLKTGDYFYLHDRFGNLRYTGKGQTLLRVRQRNNQIEVYNRLGYRLLRTNGNLFLSYDNPAATTVLIDIQFSNGNQSGGGRVYRGKFQFLRRDQGVTIVNQVRLEEYLYGVVPSEMESSWPAAALEAQAVAARTYAIANKNSFSSRGFDLLPTVASQVYRGVRVETRATNAAVDATRGRILIYNQKPINAFYTGNNGGYSASSQELWGVNVPYLQAEPDKMLSPENEPTGPEDLAEWLTNRPSSYSSNPNYSARSHYRWTDWVSHQEIENRLKLGDKIGRVILVDIVGQATSGIVTKVCIKGTNGEYNVTGDAIRSKLGGLKSNMFIVEPKLGKDGLPEYYIFYGGGWGHGVGLCQSGAAGMAADGYPSLEILSHYYPGTEITKLY